jgi:hypothetical protein
MKFISSLCVASMTAFLFTGAPNVAAYTDDLREFGDDLIRDQIYGDEKGGTQGKPCCKQKTVTTAHVNDSTNKVDGPEKTQTFPPTAENPPPPKDDGKGGKITGCGAGNKDGGKMKTQSGGQSAKKTSEKWWDATPVMGDDGKQVKDKAGNPVYKAC